MAFTKPISISKTPRIDRIKNPQQVTKSRHHQHAFQFVSPITLSSFTYEPRLTRLVGTLYRAVSGVSSAKATDRSAESCRDKDTNISPDIFPASDSHAGDTEDNKKERQDELLIGVGSLLNIGTMVPSKVFPTPDSDSAEITDEKKKRQDELLIGIGSQYNKGTFFINLHYHLLLSLSIIIQLLDHLLISFHISLSAGTYSKIRHHRVGRFDALCVVNIVTNMLMRNK